MWVTSALSVSQYSASKTISNLRKIAVLSHVIGTFFLGGGIDRLRIPSERGEGVECIFHWMKTRGNKLPLKVDGNEK